jgi:hypothetical protein
MLREGARCHAASGGNPLSARILARVAMRSGGVIAFHLSGGMMQEWCSPSPPTKADMSLTGLPSLAATLAATLVSWAQRVAVRPCSTCLSCDRCKRPQAVRVMCARATPLPSLGVTNRLCSLSSRSMRTVRMCRMDREWDLMSGPVSKQ